jgi:hypothetical protein
MKGIGGTFTVWAPGATQRVTDTFIRIAQNLIESIRNRPRSGNRVFLFGGCLFWFIILFVLMAVFSIGFEVALAYVGVYLFIVAGIWAAQIVHWTGQGVRWAAWGWWH